MIGLTCPFAHRVRLRSAWLFVLIPAARPVLVVYVIVGCRMLVCPCLCTVSGGLNDLQLNIHDAVHPNLVAKSLPGFDASSGEAIPLRALGSDSGASGLMPAKV